MTNQPIWRFVANLGDASPLDYGGYFLYEDTTGVYGFEAEKVEEPYDEVDPESNKARWTIHRVCLDRCKMVDGNLVSFNYKPEWPYPVAAYVEWFAKDLASVANCMGTTEQELIDALCSKDGKALAWAYQCIADYHGWNNLDDYPLTLTRAEVEARYKDELK